MKALRQTVCLLMICSGFVLVQGFSAASTTTELSQPKTTSDRSLLQELRNKARGSVAVEREPATNRAGFITVGRNGDLMPGNSARPVDKAAAFLGKYGALMGATDTRQLVQTGRATDKYGTTVTYSQAYRGVPVFGATVLAHLNSNGALTAVNGTAVPGLTLSTTPRLSAQQIQQRAVAYVKSDPPTTDEGKAGDTTGIRALSPQLLVYRTGLIRGETGDNYLAYRVEVTNRTNVRDIVFLHADSGKVLNRYSMISAALNRKLYEKTYDPTALTWKEGDAFPGSLTQDQQNIVLASGESYYFFKNSFGRDSYDGAGHVMETVNNDPRISCPNANWNGTTTNYCNGVTSDDVVAHEWGHAYTEYTHDLIYQWQPGALNESYSDIWGETVDLINNRMDSDEGDITAKRADNACTTHTGIRPVLVINSPADIAKVCTAGAAAFGPQLTTTGVTGNVVQALDTADASGPSTTDACTAITNASSVAGKVAIVDRGSCPFVQKTKNVQAAGAIAAVIGNNQPGEPFPMSGTDPAITIPTVMISQANRNVIVSKLSTATVNVTMKDGGSDGQNSYRWLIGEDSTAFGGAIRDMWTPTCVGDPGKVSDAQYQCATSDGGGVHSNSGVPNHGYALLVNGGNYNNVTIPALGMAKAAHIYWRAQSEYQTPATDFADHADALKASCVDLIGQTLAPLSTAGAPENTSSPAPVPASGPITAADCDAVDAMALAVELRKAPTQCNFQPLLGKNPPSACGPGTRRNVVFSDDFTAGLGRWALTNQGVYAGWPGVDWTADSDLPGDRPGTAAFGEDLDGSCGDPTADVSGVMRMQSPLIRIPADGQKNPVLAFDHYVATEAGYDGGNVKISVNGKPFEVVPASAYIYNQPTRLASAADGNTNPLAGEEGFTGTDGGEVTGSWGQSLVNLTMVHVRPDDRVVLRFDFGMDGCGNVDGWYVDDVTVSTCIITKPKPKPVLAREAG